MSVGRFAVDRRPPPRQPAGRAVNCGPLTADSRRRIAWFSPLTPLRSGISAYSAELLPYLERAYAIDPFDEARAHDFVWKQRREPYDLVVYQLGNAPCHDYMWAYLAAYPGLVVLHDARLHHARARQLLAAERASDYRHEFWYDHPDARKNFVEYAIAGMGGPIYYFWPMRRVVMRTARVVAVHNARVAEELRRENAEAIIETVRMGVPRCTATRDAGARLRRARSIPDTAIVFAAFGKMTPEKRIAQIGQAFATLVTIGYDAHLLLVGDEGDSPHVADLAPPRLTGRIHAAGYVDDADIGAYLQAADVCLCLRWPTALETSASWLRCLAAARATIVSDLAHTADVPSSVARRVDLLDENRSLLETMRELATNEGARVALARAGHEWWAAHHTMETMADDYGRTIGRALAAAPPRPSDLPRHFVDDHNEPTRTLAREFGLTVDIVD